MRSAFALLLLFTACGDDDVAMDAGTGDSGADSATMIGPLPSGAMLVAPTLPTPPAPVAMTCAEGWRRVPPTEEGWAEICSPWTGSAPLDCEPGEIQLPGSSECAPLGEACPTDGWPAGTPAPTVYVDPETTAGGDGSRASPFATLAEALVGASAGTVVALAAGTHASVPITVPPGVEVRGACAARTLVEVADSGAPAFDLGVGARLADLAVSAAGAAIQVSGGDATLRAVEVRRAPSGGVVVGPDATLAAERVAIRLSDADEGRGVGVQVDRGAVATLSGLHVDGAMQYAVVASGAGATLRLADATLRDTARLGMAYGYGVFAADGADVSLERCALSNNATGLWADGADTRLALDQVLVADGQPDIGASVGMVFDGGTLTVRSTAFVNLVGSALLLQDGGSATLEDVVIRETQLLSVGPMAGQFGTGINLFTDAESPGDLELDATRLAIEASRNAGVVVYGEGSTARLSDVSVMEVAGSPRDIYSGEGLFVLEGGHAVVERGLFEDIDLNALRATEDAELAISDVTVRDVTGVEFNGVGGHGLASNFGAQLTGERILIERARQSAVLVTTEATATLTDVTVSDVRSGNEASLFQGLGTAAWIATGAEGSIERFDVDGVVGAGVVCLTEGSRCRIVDTSVTGTETWERDDLLGQQIGLGFGILHNDAALELERVVLSSNRAYGAQFIRGTVSIEDLVVSQTREDEVSRYGGVGMTASSGTRVTGGFVDIESNRGMGLGAFGEGTTIDLTDVRIVMTAQNPCADDGCAEDPGGVGAVARGGGAVTLRRFEIAQSALAGVMIAEGGQADLHQGTVRSNPIGANVQDPTFDISRLQDDVTYVDNDSNLDATSLPVPQPPMDVEIDDMPEEPAM